MFSFGIPVSQRLQGLLEQENPSLDEVLEDDSCIRAFKQRYMPLLDYLKNNAFTILNIALSDNPNAIKAYQLFSQENDTLANQIGENTSELENFAKTIFESPSDIVYINRFAFITQLVVVAKQTLQYNFIEQFFKYLHLRAVYGIFEAIFTPGDNQLAALQQEMADDHFVTKLLDYLKTLKDASTPEAEGQICSIYKLIGLMVPSPQLKPEVTKAETVSTLLLEFTNPTERVLAEKWATINLLINDETYTLVEACVNTLLEYLKISGDKFFPHQVEAIRALAKLIPFSETTRNAILGANTPALLTQIASQFQTSTFAQLAIIEFAKASLEHEEIAKPLLTQLFEYAATVMTDDKALTSARAFVWKLFEEIQEASTDSGNAAITDMDPATKELIEKMSATSKAEYGGPVPEPLSFSDDSLGNLSPEQIMALLKFLTGGGGLA